MYAWTLVPAPSCHGVVPPMTNNKGDASSICAFVRAFCFVLSVLVLLVADERVCEQHPCFCACILFWSVRAVFALALAPLAAPLLRCGVTAPHVGHLRQLLGCGLWWGGAMLPSASCCSWCSRTKEDGLLCRLTAHMSSVTIRWVGGSAQVWIFLFRLLYLPDGFTGYVQPPLARLLVAWAAPRRDLLGNSLFSANCLCISHFNCQCRWVQQWLLARER